RCHAFKSNRQKECVQMSGKMARSDLDQAFGLPEVLVAVSTSRLSCKRAGKTRTLMPVWDSSGESRLRDIRPYCHHSMRTSIGSTLPETVSLFQWPKPCYTHA